MNTLFENVTLVYTKNMNNKSKFGDYGYSFIINKDIYTSKVQESLQKQIRKNKLVWNDFDLNEDMILKRSNVLHFNNVQNEEIKKLMSENDILVSVKTKESPIRNSKNCLLAWGTKADVTVDIFGYDYKGDKFICRRDHSDKEVTIFVTKLIEYKPESK